MATIKQTKRLPSRGAVTHSEWIDKSIGKVGTKSREKYEANLKIEFNGIVFPTIIKSK